MSWINAHINDTWVKKSKQFGFLSRSYFKFEQINNKYNILYKNSQVLDLGAAPGGWSQYIYKFTHNITAVDIEKKNWKMTNIPLIECDIFNLELTQKFDLIVSDIACNMSGIKDIDQPSMNSIIYAILNIVNKNLRVNGNFVCKIFAYNQHIFSKLKMFKEQSYFKPEASRSESAEIYFIGKRFIGPQVLEME